MLDIDYLLKRKFHNSAKAFQQEGEVSTDPVAIDAPGGFLSEWWPVFWDIFIARSNQKHSETAASYIVMQGCICFIYDFKLQIYHKRCYLEEKGWQLRMIKAQEQQQHQQKPQHQQQQYLLMQRHVQGQQQHRRDGPQIPNGSSTSLVGNSSLMMQNPVTANAMASKMYEDTVKLPHPGDA